MGKMILIVDDDPGVRKTFGEILTEQGYETLEAADGQEAVQKVHKERPDVVLLDTVLPITDGHDVCRQIKNIEGLTIKVIIYTGKIDAIDAGRARESGADDYIIKASDLSYLLEAIKNV